MSRRLLYVAGFLAILSASLPAQTAHTASPNPAEKIKFVVYLSRHGVRSPTGKPAQYNAYSAASWPDWDVPPGYLTAHGYQLMQIFGAYDRLLLSGEGLLSATGCEDAARVTFYADSDQRTRETGKALAAGLFPGCAPAVKGIAEGTRDELFHPLGAHHASLDPALAVAAISGRIGGNPNNPTEAYHTQLTELDRILGHCGHPATPAANRQSILEIPAKLTSGPGDHLADLRGPLSTASNTPKTWTQRTSDGAVRTAQTCALSWSCIRPHRNSRSVPSRLRAPRRQTCSIKLRCLSHRPKWASLWLERSAA
jgi:4-phytase/acid phosphatase